MPYVMLASIAYAYASVHYRDMPNSLLSDIESGRNIKAADIAKYKFREIHIF